MAIVFVYGTLKRSFPFHDLGLRAATYLGTCQTVQPYPMCIAKSFYGPVMLDRPGTGLQVAGELYNVPEDALAKLDELEDVGQPGSFRSTVEVQPIGGGVSTAAIGFMKDETWLSPQQSGLLADYQDRRFIPPWERP